jgi:hypothetical protein
MITLTKEQFIEKYGDVEMHFTSYYKYTFSFEGKTPNGETIKASVGGSADDIYRFEVCTGSNGTFSSLDPECGYVYDSNDNKVCEMEYQGW